MNKFFFPILWGWWTSYPPQEVFSQIWLQVKEKSIKFLKSCYVLATCKKLGSKYVKVNLLSLKFSEYEKGIPIKSFGKIITPFLGHKMTKFYHQKLKNMKRSKIIQMIHYNCFLQRFISKVKKLCNEKIDPRVRYVTQHLTTNVPSIGKLFLVMNHNWVNIL
jgi:hypothetical protein